MTRVDAIWINLLGAAGILLAAAGLFWWLIQTRRKAEIEEEIRHRRSKLKELRAKEARLQAELLERFGCD